MENLRCTLFVTSELALGQGGLNKTSCQGTIVLSSPINKQRLHEKVKCLKGEKILSIQIPIGWNLA